VTGEPGVRHYTSHRSVLKPAPAAVEAGSLDAIVMPAARPADRLLHGMELAARLGSEFVALCSGDTQLPEAAGLAREVPGLSCVLVDLQDGWTSELLEFRTSRFEAATRRRHSDLSTKRNIGLLLARMVGWKRILFLDDDISLDADLVRGAAATLRAGRATGMRALDFPDNSVVSHALREVGLDQDVFVSGSALLVDTTRVDSFFPDVYNEDWFFLFDAVRFGQVSAFGEVSQEKYDPFADPGRAVREEFGDVLAEGLMSLLHYGGGTQRALTEKHWDTVLDQRRAMLRSIADLLDTGEKPEAAKAVRAARAETDSLTGALLARYVRQWQRDVRLWRGRIQALPPRRHQRWRWTGCGCRTCPFDRESSSSSRSSVRAGSCGSGLRRPVRSNPSLRYSWQAASLPSSTHSQTRGTPHSRRCASIRIITVVPSPRPRAGGATQR
jgi:hypothetical protein